MVVIVDYRAGNLYNVANALKHLGAEFAFSGDPRVVARAERVILPGVGSARAAMQSLNEKGLVPVLKELKVPFLGICLGLQLLFERSEEDDVPCLGLLQGVVKKFDERNVKVPHIGWDRIAFAGTAPHPLLEGIPDRSHFYFVHSYYAPVVSQSTLAVCDYDVPFSGVVRKGNFLAVQFHPERSALPGLKLLANFLERV